MWAYVAEFCELEGGTHTILFLSLWRLQGCGKIRRSTISPSCSPAASSDVKMKLFWHSTIHGDRDTALPVRFLTHSLSLIPLNLLYLKNVFEVVSKRSWAFQLTLTLPLTSPLSCPPKPDWNQCFANTGRSKRVAVNN